MPVRRQNLRATIVGPALRGDCDERDERIQSTWGGQANGHPRWRKRRSGPNALVGRVSCSHDAAPDRAFEIRTQDASTFLTLGSEAAGDQWQDIQLILNSFVGGADPYFSLTWFISKQMGHWNWERFANEDFDRLNDRALATNNIDERDQIYQQMQDLMEESGCYRFISNGVMPQIILNTIKPAFSPDGDAILRSCRPSERRD